MFLNSHSKCLICFSFHHRIKPSSREKETFFSQSTYNPLQFLHRKPQPIPHSDKFHNTNQGFVPKIRTSRSNKKNKSNPKSLSQSPKLPPFVKSDQVQPHPTTRTNQKTTPEKNKKLGYALKHQNHNLTSPASANTS